jgi:hypothetical protein
MYNVYEERFSMPGGVAATYDILWMQAAADRKNGFTGGSRLCSADPRFIHTTFENGYKSLFDDGRRLMNARLRFCSMLPLSFKN